MRGRQVQRLEVVPVGLGLRPFGHREAHAHEHVFEALGGLGDQVQVPTARTRQRLGEVLPLLLQLVAPGRSGQHIGGLGMRIAQLLLSVVQRAPRSGPVLLRQRAKRLLHPPERRLPPEQA